jgi:hypothetical protein
MANWWDEAYSAVQNWSVNANQLNPDRGAYQDAFTMNAAEKGLNQDITTKLMDKSYNQDLGKMQSSADLDLRNSKEMMATENTFKIAGMEKASQLSLGYLAAESAEGRTTLKEQGNQSRQLQEVTNTGMKDVEGIRAAASNYSQDQANRRVGLQGEQDRRNYATQGEEQRRGIVASGEQERLNIGTQGEEQRRGIVTSGEQERLNIGAQGEEQRKGLVTSGEQERLSIGARGEQDRSTVSRTAEEQRKTGISEREHAAGLAVRWSRR